MITTSANSRFQAMNKHVTEICIKLANNEVIAKNILNHTMNPMRKDLDELLEENGYRRCNQLIGDYILPYTFIPDAQEEQKIFIMIGIDDFRLNKRGHSVKNGIVTVDILCHKDLVMTNDGVRTYSIMAEIDKELNGYFIGVSPLVFDKGIIWYKQPKQYVGYGLAYVMANAN